MKTVRLKQKSKYYHKGNLEKRKAWKRLREITGFTIPLDGLLSALSNEISIDILKLDKMIPNYNGDACTYKGKPNYSMRMAVEEEWGKEASELIEILL